MCRRCSGIAKLRVIRPPMFTGQISEASYLCEKCGTETKRRIYMEDYRA